MIARVDDQVDDRVRLQVASMGGRAVLEAYGVGRAVLHDAADLLEELELLWSRFEPSSELNALCRAAGTPVRVSKRTFGLVEALVDAWFRTGGRFDPTIRRALEAHGYDRDFLDIRPVIGGAHMSATGPSPGCENIVLDAAELIVELPVGMLLDAGGLAKGLAADIVASFVMERGATGVVANLAGDIRTMGVGPLDGSRLRRGSSSCSPSSRSRTPRAPM